MTGFISQSDQEEIDDLARQSLASRMADYNDASRRNDLEGRRQARQKIDNKVTQAIDTVHELIGSYLYDRDDDGNIVR